MCSNQFGIENSSMFIGATSHSLVTAHTEILGPVVPADVGLVAIEDAHIKASGERSVRRLKTPNSPIYERILGFESRFLQRRVAWNLGFRAGIPSLGLVFAPGFLFFAE